MECYTVDLGGGGGGAGGASAGVVGNGASGSQSRTANAFVWPEVERRLLELLAPSPGGCLIVLQMIPVTTMSTTSNWLGFEKISLSFENPNIFAF